MAANQNVTQLTQQTGTAATSSLFYAVTGGNTDTGLPLSVLFNSPAFTGTPVVPTPAPGTNTTQIASTAFVVASYAPIASPTFTGTVTIPSGASISGYLTSATASTTYAPIASPTFTGTVTAPALTMSGLITPSTTSGIKGTTLADNANAGSIGEVISGSTLTVSMSNGVAANVTTMSLTAGDWDVAGQLIVNPAATTTLSTLTTGASTTTGAFNTVVAGIPNFTEILQFGSSAGFGAAVPIPLYRLNISTTTTVYLVAQIDFNISTLTCSGYIWARRVR
jgi:hypothetical protein